MRVPVFSALLAVSWAGVALAQDLPLQPGLYVGTDTGCADGHPGNSFTFEQIDGLWLLRWVTSFTALDDIAPQDGQGGFSVSARIGSLPPGPDAFTQPMRLEIRGQDEFALISEDGAVYPHARRCGPLPG